jgi:L-rhamnose-H+ transport protein
LKRFGEDPCEQHLNRAGQTASVEESRNFHTEQRKDSSCCERRTERCMSNAAGGLAILVLASMMNASFTLPMKYTSRWAWENTWMAWTIFALLILPPVITLSTVPRLGEIYASVDPSMLLVVMLFGVGWGVAQVFFGLAVDAIGIALTFSLVLGTSAAVGTIILLARLHPERLQTAAGRGVLGGVALVIGGVLLCATAGRMR